MTRVHLKEAIALIGLPPVEFVKRGKRWREFCDEEGRFIANERQVEGAKGMEELEENFEEGEEWKVAFFGVREGYGEVGAWGDKDGEGVAGE